MVLEDRENNLQITLLTSNLNFSATSEHTNALKMASHIAKG